jgi:four helix bundle protein
MGARNYCELHVWRLCEEIRVRVLAETERGGAGLDLRFRTQIRSAAEDAASDIAEGFTRFHPRTFAQFIGYALSSLDEVRERTRYAHSRKYFSDAAAAEIMVLCARAEQAAKSPNTCGRSPPATYRAIRSQ